MKKKVLHIINSMKPGGAEMLLANSLSGGGLCDSFENHLAYFTGDSYLTEKLDGSVTVHCLEYKGTMDLVRTLGRLKKILVENRIDLIHSHLNPAGVYANLVRPRHIPQLHTLHTTYSMDKMTHPFKLLLERNFFLKRKDAQVILLSEFIRQDFLKAVPFKGKTYVVNNFVADEYFAVQKKYAGPDEPLKAIAIGSLHPIKNHSYLLDVLEHLRACNISLDIYGGGDIAAFEESIARRKLPVRMKGHVKNISEVIGAYDLFLMPSLFEGFPLSVFEAMAAGLHCLLSDIAPLHDIAGAVADFFPLDDAAATAGKIIHLYANRDELVRKAVQAKQYAQTIARKENYSRRLESIYAEILGPQSAG